MICSQNQEMWKGWYFIAASKYSVSSWGAEEWVEKRWGVPCPHNMKVSPPSFLSGGEGGGGIPHKRVLDSHQKNLNYSVCKTLKKTNLGMALFFLTLKNTIFSWISLIISSCSRKEPVWVDQTRETSRNQPKNGNKSTFLNNYFFFGCVLEDNLTAKNSMVAFYHE